MQCVARWLYVLRVSAGVGSDTRSQGNSDVTGRDQRARHVRARLMMGKGQAYQLPAGRVGAVGDWWHTAIGDGNAARAAG
jgi:hypothetical protein